MPSLLLSLLWYCWGAGMWEKEEKEIQTRKQWGLSCCLLALGSLFPNPWARTRGLLGSFCLHECSILGFRLCWVLARGHCGGKNDKLLPVWWYFELYCSSSVYLAFQSFQAVYSMPSVRSHSRHRWRHRVMYACLLYLELEPQRFSYTHYMSQTFYIQIIVFSIQSPQTIVLNLQELREYCTYEEFTREWASENYKMIGDDFHKF